MGNIIQLTHEVFTEEQAVANAVELLKKRSGEDVAVLFPSAHVEALFSELASLSTPIEARSYEPGEGKLKAAHWAVDRSAPAVEQWGLVEGLYTADPALIPTAEIIESLNYQEAQELAAAGTQLLDRKALQVLEQHGVELHIRSVYEKRNPKGTVVNTAGSSKGVKAVSCISNVALVTLSGSAFEGVAGVDARAFGALAAQGISVKLASQASSERSLGMVVAASDAEAAKMALDAAFESDDTSVSLLPGLTILNIVGRHNYALERAIYELRRNNIWLHLIANSVEGHQISFVLDGGKERKALQLVHSQLVGSVKRLNVFCFGKGLVGGTFIRQVLESHAHVLDKRHLDVRIIGVANTQGATFHPEGLSADWEQDLSNRPESNDPEQVISRLEQSGLSNIVVVDNTADQRLTNAYPKFVAAGFDLVASNKKGNAREQSFYDELRALLRRKGKRFRYETNVGAGLPLIDTLIQLHHSHDKITRIKGVFSGSMSFLFNTFSERKQSFAEVLQQAQALGYTEPDPREDLNGMDVARKLLILARTVDVRAELEDIRIENLIPERMRELASFQDFMDEAAQANAHYQGLLDALPADQVFRYVGDLSIDPIHGAKLQVALVAVPKQSPLGGIRGSDSLFEIYTEGYGDQPMVIQGAGAGAEVTARGVYSDVLRLGE